MREDIVYIQKVCTFQSFQDLLKRKYSACIGRLLIFQYVVIINRLIFGADSMCLTCGIADSQEFGKVSNNWPSQGLELLSRMGKGADCPGFFYIQFLAMVNDILTMIEIEGYLVFSCHYYFWNIWLHSNILTGL